MTSNLTVFENKYLDKVIHFCGIGGVSMSGLATILHKSGYSIQGSDTSPGNNLSALIEEGVLIYPKQDKNNLKNVDVFIMSLAIKPDNVEYIYAKENNIPIIQRHELLGQILDNFGFTVAVSGTHGKTTTSSLIGYILRLSKLDPSLHIGSDLFYEKHGTFFSGSEYFVLEACEYGNSFHYFKPYIGVVLNIDADHLDFFKDIDDVSEGFKGFVSGIKPNGFVVYYSGDKNTNKIIANSDKKSISFGYKKEDDYRVDSIKISKKHTTFTVFKKGVFYGNFKICILGTHNVLNSLCAIAVCDLLDADIHYIKKGLLTFKGADRRLEYLGKSREGFTVYDDYAHHPTEIKASLSALANIKKRRLFCVFQPHTYTRTKALFDDFLVSFDDCDKLIITDIYSAREKNVHNVSSKDLCEKIEHPSCVYLKNFDDCVEYIRKNAAPDDLIVTMGAGDIFKISHSLVGKNF